jgi:hypothetical protein
MQAAQKHVVHKMDLDAVLVGQGDDFLQPGLAQTLAHVHGVDAARGGKQQFAHGVAPGGDALALLQRLRPGRFGRRTRGALGLSAGGAALAPGRPRIAGAFGRPGRAGKGRRRFARKVHVKIDVEIVDRGRARGLALGPGLAVAAGNARIVLAPSATALGRASRLAGAFARSGAALLAALARGFASAFPARTAGGPARTARVAGCARAFGTRGFLGICHGFLPESASLPTRLASGNVQV